MEIELVILFIKQQCTLKEQLSIYQVSKILKVKQKVVNKRLRFLLNILKAYSCVFMSTCVFMRILEGVFMNMKRMHTQFLEEDYSEITETIHLVTRNKFFKEIKNDINSRNSPSFDLTTGEVLNIFQRKQ